MFTKISICLFLLRIVDSRKVRIALYSLIGGLVLFTSVSVCLFLGVCRPSRAYWDVGVNGICLSNHQVESVVLAQGSKSLTWSGPVDLLNRPVLSVFTDLICAAFPIFFLRNLQVKLRTKVALCLLMGLGVMYASRLWYETG